MSDEPAFPVARSSRPSPLKSPATISNGADPAARPLELITPLPVVGLLIGGLKRPVAVAQEHGDIVGVGVGDGQIEMAVAEVTRHDRCRVWADGQRRHRLGLERAVAVALEDVDHASTRVGHGQVEIAVAEVARHDRCRTAEAGKLDGLRRRETPPALIGQDGDIRRVDVGDGQEVAVLAERCPWRSRRGLTRPGSGSTE